jgi:hypothetical protein
MFLCRASCIGDGSWNSVSLERYGAAALQDAILEALVRDVPPPNAARLALERWREQNCDVPPVAPVLPTHVQARDAPPTASTGNL